MGKGSEQQPLEGLVETLASIDNTLRKLVIQAPRSAGEGVASASVAPVALARLGEPLSPEQVRAERIARARDGLLRARLGITYPPSKDSDLLESTEVEVVPGRHAGAEVEIVLDEYLQSIFSRGVQDVIVIIGSNEFTINVNDVDRAIRLPNRPGTWNIVVACDNGEVFVGESLVSIEAPSVRMKE